MTGAGTELALGTAGLGNLYRVIDEATAVATVEAALVGGIALFDTAPHYGFGLAEERLGAALAGSEAGRNARISTKVGRTLVPTTAGGTRHGFVDARPFEPRFDYRGQAIQTGFTQSLARLRRDRVDTLLAHDLGELTHGDDHAHHVSDFLDSGYRAMADLKAAGMAARIGIGVNEVAVCLDLLDRVDLDVILLAGRYTLLDQAAHAELLPRCAARGVAVMIGGPFNSGILAGEAGRHYDYAEPSAGVLARVERLQAVCDSHGVALASAALAFAGQHPAVQAVIAGLVGVDQVTAALAHWHSPPPPALWDDMRKSGLIA